MLEKPDIRDEAITACLRDAYGLPVAQLAFLPLGADANTAVYRGVTEDETPYFVKLRGGIFDETSVSLPKHLSDQGIRQIIAPLTTKTGQLWANLDPFKLILYPFVEGKGGHEIPLSERHWREFGTALKRLHTAALPPEISSRIRRESYSPEWRESLKRSLGRLEHGAFDDPLAVKLATFLKARRAEVVELVGRAERLAAAVQARSPQFVVCHSDAHAYNVLIDAGGALYIIDWDDPIWAPKERDLMFIGGGQWFAGRTPQEEETLFYRGYGQTEIDPFALAYCRYERIIVDLAIYCDDIFLTDEEGEDREQAFHYLVSNFKPGGVLEISYRADKTHGDG